MVLTSLSFSNPLGLGFFSHGDINASQWCDLFLTTVKDHVPMRPVRGNCTNPWIDSERLSLTRKKEKQRKRQSATKERASPNV